MRYDPSNAEVRVFVFREGVLSAIGHDVVLRVTKFEIDVGDRVSARFDASSLRVVAAWRDGKELPGAFSAVDVRTIERNVLDILDVKRFPEIGFEGTASGGTLKLRGVERAIAFAAEGKRAEVSLDQREFGIKPYAAMFGALKVRPEVGVVVRLG